jgi:hypothetical protein
MKNTPAWARPGIEDGRMKNGETFLSRRARLFGFFILPS